MSELPNKFTVTVSPENFLNGDYADPKGCPLALALKDMFPNEKFSVSYYGVFTNTLTYGFNSKHNAALSNRAGTVNAKSLKIAIQRY